MGDTSGVDLTDLDPDPLRQVSAWLEEARAAAEPLPQAMTVATATADGVPSARMVILRGVDRGLVFFSDSASAKGADLAENPRAAAVLHWLAPRHRQVRVAGPAERVSDREADAHWSARPPASRLAVAAWPQSEVIAGRSTLEARLAESRARDLGGNTPRPPRWVGYRVLPQHAEFWQESADGMHDRLRYRRAEDRWVVERLSP